MITDDVLTDDEAHLWHVRPESVADRASLEDCRRHLTDEEREKIARFRIETDRRDRLVARALLRTVLSRYLAVNPAAWRFESNVHGRPSVSEPIAGRDLVFSLSHTRGLIVCLVARRRTLGVDAEPLDERRRSADIAGRYFAAREAAELGTWPSATRHRRFLEYWTLKEAYLKARGLGLSVPLRQFAFQLAGPGPIAIAFEPGLDDDPARWQFSLEPVVSTHVVATAMERRAGSVLRTRPWTLRSRR